MKDAQSASPTDDSLAQADIILPSQYFGTMGSAGLSGEQRLMLAVLIDAINVLQRWRGGKNARKRRNFAEAVHWVNTPGTSDLFSFDSVCDALEIDSELLRSRLRGLTVGPANSASRPHIAFLRLKELSRSQRMTAVQARRRERTPRIRTALISPMSESSSSSDRCAAETL